MMRRSVSCAEALFYYARMDAVGTRAPVIQKCLQSRMETLPNVDMLPPTN